MFIRKLDLLSPAITLYYKGENSHSSAFSGVITIIVYSICLTFAIFYAIQFINKTNPRVCYYNRYVEDAGEFPVNSSSIFNFIQILDTVENIPFSVDFDLLTIVGLEETVDIYETNNDLSKYNHWIYGKCNNSSDIVGLHNLINFNNFTESACIRKYYNKNENKYYNTNEKGFIWPNILHGCSHPNRTFFGIIVEKCRNNTLKLLSDGKYCKSKEEIISYIKTSSINFQLIDQFTDILNYTTPYRKYFYSISNGLFEESYTTNHLNLNPTKLISDEGKFFEWKKETLSYFFDLNEKVTSSSGNSGIYVAFYFWMQNRMQYYERAYQKVQDVLSDVGGLCSIVLTIAELINNLINQYIKLYDTQSYMNEIGNSKMFDRSIFRKLSNDFIKLNNQQNANKLFPPKSSQNSKNNNDFDSANKTGLIKDDVEIFDKKIKKIKVKKKKKVRNITLKANTINLENQNNERRHSKSISSISYNQRKVINKEKIESQSKDNLKINNIDIINNNIIKKENKLEEQSQNSCEKKKSKNYFRFIDFLLYVISFTKLNQNIKIYSDFRIKMISEENLILCNLKISKLQKNYKYGNSENTELQNASKLNYNNY